MLRPKIYKVEMFREKVAILDSQIKVSITPLMREHHFSQL